MKVKYVKLLSNFAFNFNLRHYSGVDVDAEDVRAVSAVTTRMAGRCRLTPGFHS